MAYTRYVLERGMAGDVLDLMVALCPCVIGYGEIGARLMNSTETRKEGNPYLPWIEMYASEDYSDVVTAAKNQLDELSGRLMTEERFPQLSKTFGAATRLEAGFWQMGLNIL
jgi:thiaminase/transcriptional activator TenA